MGHHNQGGTLFAIERHQQVRHRLAGIVIQVAGGLIRKQNLGPRGEGSSNGNPLLLATGQLSGRMCKPVTQPYPLKQLSRLAGCFLLASQFQRQHDIFQCSQCWQQLKRLKNKPDPLGPQSRTLIFAQLTDDLPIQLDLPVRRCVQPGKQSQQCGFARAGTPDNSN